MNKTILGLLLIALILLGVGVILSGIAINRQDQEIEELKWQSEQQTITKDNLKQQLRDALTRLDESAKYNLFQQALNEIDKNDYSADYNCYEFTKDLQQELIKLDIYSVIAITKNREHSYLFVGLEATEGRFLEVDNGYEIMEIRDSNLEVIAQ